MKILVVDDERWIRKGIVKMIQAEELGIDEILEADGVRSGWQVFMEQRPELVISDVKFPVENGCVLCERIYRESPETRIIMLSGYGEFEYVKAALKYKALDYLLKPVDKNILNRTIEKACTELRSDQQLRRQEEQQKKAELGAMKGEEIVHLVMKELEEHYDQKISLGDLAERYYVNESYLSNLFTRIAGMSLMNYLMNVRVEQAKSLLLMTRMSITEIAERVGYENARYFTRVFKKLTGATPKEYRLQIEQEISE